MSDHSSSSTGSPSHSGDDILGRMAGEYRLCRKLGEGGFGAVYEAEHPLLKRRAAVKVLHQASGRDSDAVLRFVAEAQAVNQIRNRHIIDVFSFGKLQDGRHFYVMDLLEGEPLDRALARLGRLDIPTTIQLLRPIAEALDAAHAAGVVHRDIKPQNIFLTWDANGEAVPKLLDFGMAKLLADSAVHTQSGTPMGTPLYMSPEQARGEKVDGRSDIYALGIVCHELLTGQLPITAESTIAALMAHVLQPAPRLSEVRPELGSAIDQPVLAMLEKSPAARPPTAGAALAALAAAAEQAGVLIPPGMPTLPRPLPAPAPVREDAASAATLPTGEPPRVVSGTDSAGGAASRLAEKQHRPRRSRLAAVSAAAVVATVAVVVGWIALAQRTSGSSPSSGASPAAALNAAVPEALSPTTRAVASAPDPTQPPLGEPPPPAARTVELTIRGAPRGAQVWAGDRLLGETPGPMAIPYGESQISLRVTAHGHQPATLTVVPDHAIDTTLKLGPREPTARGAPRPPRRSGAAPIPSDLESPF